MNPKLASMSAMIKKSLAAPLLCAVLLGCPGRSVPASEQTTAVATAVPTAPSAQTTAVATTVTSASSAPPLSATTALANYRKQLHEAGDRGDCEAEVSRVRAALRADRTVRDQDLKDAIDHFEKVKGPMPYPTPGTACSLFGFQKAARGALEDRAAR